MSLKAKLEAVIYAAEEPVTLAQLVALFVNDALEWKAERAAALAAEPDGNNGGFPDVADCSIGDLEPAEPAQSDPVYESIALSSEPEVVDSAIATGTGSKAEEESQTSTEEGKEVADAVEPVLDFQRVARLRDREARAVIRELLNELISNYESDSRGIEIREIAGGYRMATKPECHDAVRSFVKSLKPALKLSLPALETLAVIAYKQPVTAPEVNEIRGVDSSGVFGSLLARKLIATAGRKQVIGRPILYKTTREFLLRVGLKDVSELPSMEEFEKMASIELDEADPSPDWQPSSELDSESTPEIDEAEGDEQAHDTGNTTQVIAEPIETAEMADSQETTTHQEVAPAAPLPTEQAETENLPDGEEENQTR
jgi:segregation and condensation protein B